MLYKYRSINNFKFFIDIVAKNRLYASPYLDLNDPMEGQYLLDRDSGDVDENIKKIIVGEAEKIRICSLSRSANNPLMWSHYADGARGIVIGLEVADKKVVTRSIQYGNLEVLSSFKKSEDIKEVALKILSRKLAAWSYEDEERVFTFDNSRYIDVKIRKIIIGARMSNQDKSLLVSVCHKLCPEVEIVK